MSSKSSFIRMHIEPYRVAHEAAVQAMNTRLSAAGSRWNFYDRHDPDWMPLDPRNPDQPVWRQYFLACDDAGEVHAGYVLREQVFSLNGDQQILATWQGPISEGHVDSRFSKAGPQCLMDMRERNPLLFGWGGSDRLNALLEALGWTRVGTPMLLKIFNASRFLKQAKFVRTSAARSRLADLLAASGGGKVGIAAFQIGQAVATGPAPATDFDYADGFGQWAEDVWLASRHLYGCAAVRTLDALKLMMGGPGWPEVRIIRIGGKDMIGWAALKVTPMVDDFRFGTMSVGCIVDLLALPGHEGVVAMTATEALRQQGVDVIAGNYTHPIWLTAFRQAGHFVFENRRELFVSQDLETAAQLPAARLAEGMHLTPIDGDGPRAL